MDYTLWIINSCHLMKFYGLQQFRSSELFRITDIKVTEQTEAMFWIIYNTKYVSIFISLLCLLSM